MGASAIGIAQTFHLDNGKHPCEDFAVGKPKIQNDPLQGKRKIPTGCKASST